MDNSDITMSIPKITNSYVKVNNNLPLPSGRSSSTLPYNKNSSINKLITDFSNRTDSEEELKVPKNDVSIKVSNLLGKTFTKKTIGGAQARLMPG